MDSIQTERPKRMSVQEVEDELADTKADLSKMQSLLNQMQAVFALVENPTLPANHVLELNVDMWRVDQPDAAAGGPHATSARL